MKNRNFAMMFSFEFLLYVWLWLSVTKKQVHFLQKGFKKVSVELSYVL